jgi:flagellar hook-length control protein FliK
MNELLNVVNLPVSCAESPPGVSPKEGPSPGVDGFAAMLSQFGQAIPALTLPGMTDAETQQGEVGSAEQVALLQLLNSVGLTGQQSAMDGLSTGSLPINTPQVALLQLLNSVGLTGQPQVLGGLSTGSLPINLQQSLDLLSLNLGASPVETLMTARQLLTSAISASTNPEPIVDMASPKGAEARLPVDLMLSSGDLTRLQSILSEVLSKSPQPMALQPSQSQSVLTTLMTNLPDKASQLTGLEQLLKEQFPTLNIENLSAQLHLKSPELVKTEVAPIALPKALPYDGLPVRPSTGQSVDAILQQPTQQNRPQANLCAEVLTSSTLPEPNASQTNIAASDPVTQPAQTVVVSQPALPTETKQQSTLTTTPEIINPVEKGNLEKTAVTAVENAGDYSQTTQHWSKVTSNQSELPVAKQVAETVEPQVDKTKFKIQFDRFQIDTLLQRSEIKLQLHPTNLGSMRVRLVSTSQEVTARFETTSEAARIAVEQNLPQLRESLDKAGIKVDHVEVVLDEQRARQQQSHYQNHKKHFSGTDVAEDVSQFEPVGMR